jgi:uncharacterized protein (TIGR02145 family)
MRNKLFVLIASSFFISCAEGTIDAADLIACGSFDAETHFCDKRDGNLYKYVIMPDGKEWMAENLKYEYGQSVCYRNNQDNCEVYGRLYSWDDREAICPEGWRIPHTTDWHALVGIIGELLYEKQLRAKNAWDYYDGNKATPATDDYGFSLLPGGAYRAKYVGVDVYEDESICEGVGIVGEYPEWGGDEESLGQIAVLMLSTEGAKEIISNDPNAIKFCVAANALVSVRCIKN